MTELKIGNGYLTNSIYIGKVRTYKDGHQEWQDAWLKVGIRMAIRCKQHIDNIPIALIPTGSARECWNGYREEEE